MRNKALILTLLAAACTTGCGNTQTAKKEGDNNWKFARAGVMSSLAKNQYESGNLDDAEKTVSQALKIMPDSMPLLLLSAKVHIERNELDGAEFDLKHAGTIEPNNPEVDYLTGVVYQRYQRFEEALTSYSSACAKNPTNLAYPLAKSEMLSSLDRLPEALDVLTACEKAFSHSAVLHDAIGQVQSQQKNYHAAAISFRQACSLAPDEWPLKEHLAHALYKDGQYDAAQVVYDRLLHETTYAKRSDLFQLAGESALAAKHYDAARGYFESVTQLDPDKAAGWMDLTKTSLELKDLDRAELASRRALAVAPADAEAHLLAGSVKLEQGRYEMALAAFHRAATLAPADPMPPALAAYTLQQLGRRAEARQALQVVLAQHPNDPFATQLMGEFNSGIATVRE